MQRGFHKHFVFSNEDQVETDTTTNYLIALQLLFSPAHLLVKRVTVVLCRGRILTVFSICKPLITFMSQSW